MLERRAAVAEDSDLAERLRGTGLCFFGLTTVPEMGLSLASEPAAGPICRNPLDAGRTPGGSSGGAAAAVAAGIVPIAHATDAGGSMRVRGMLRSLRPQGEPGCDRGWTILRQSSRRHCQ